MPVLQSVPEVRHHWWKALFESSEDAQLVCDRHAQIYQFNARAGLLLELRSQQFNPNILEFFTEATGKIIQTALSGRPCASEELKSVSLISNGRVRQLTDINLAKLDESHWLITLKDASRRWRMESHVNRLATALDATPDVFFLTDSDYNITYVNTAFRTVTGYTIEDALGRSADFITGHGAECG